MVFHLHKKEEEFFISAFIWHETLISQSFQVSQIFFSPCELETSFLVIWKQSKVWCIRTEFTTSFFYLHYLFLWQLLRFICCFERTFFVGLLAREKEVVLEAYRCGTVSGLTYCTWRKMKTCRINFRRKELKCHKSSKLITKRKDFIKNGCLGIKKKEKRRRIIWRKDNVMFL